MEIEKQKDELLKKAMQQLQDKGTLFPDSLESAKKFIDMAVVKNTDESLEKPETPEEGDSEDKPDREANETIN